jgi:type I restriction enzyme, S subunit
MNKDTLAESRWFTIGSILDNDRIDCEYYDPTYFEVINDLRKTSRSPKFRLVPVKRLLDPVSEKNITGGATPLGAVYLTEGIPFIRIQNVKEDGLDLSDVVFIGTQVHEGELLRSQLQAGDVLLTITGSYGISTVVYEEVIPSNINQHVVRMNFDKNQVNPKYMSLYLNSQYGRKQMDRAATGSTRFALDYPSIKRLLVLLPEKTVQADVVSEVQKIYWEANTIKKAISELERSFDSIFLDRLSVTLPNESKLKTFLTSLNAQDRLEVKWHYPYFEQVMHEIRALKSKNLDNYNHKLEYGASIDADYISDIPFLRIENLRRNYIDVSNLQYIPSGVYKNQVANLYLQEGDILIERSGTYVGLCSYVPAGIEDYVYGSYIIRLKLEDEALLPRYVSAYLNSILGRIQFDRLKTGSLQFNINMQHIRAVEIIEPDINVQEDIASSVFSLIDKISELKKQYRERISEAKKRFIELLN